MSHRSQPVTVAVVTGGHSYDAVEFDRVWRSLDGIDAVVQHMDEFAAAPKATREAFDAIVFYTMLRENPPAALSELGATEQGIVMLHHALFAYPEWESWQAMTGIVVDNGFYSMGETLTSEIVDPSHPVTEGIAPWTMVDETYRLTEPDGDSEVLIAYDHPRSMRAVAWTRQCRASRVFCYQAGHDGHAWSTDGFRAVLTRGIAWLARRL